MSLELVVSNFNDDLNIALLEDGALLELHKNVEQHAFNVGDIYVGKIKKLAPNLNAAFVNIGLQKDAFLHYHDLGPNVPSLLKFLDLSVKKKINSPKLGKFQMEPPISKDGKIMDVYKPGDITLVQITKEPISTKGARISSELSLAGRFMVLTPFSDKVSVSKKITSQAERTRIKNLMESIKPEGFGIIVRTASEGKKVAELHADLNLLLAKWNKLFMRLQSSKIPSRVLMEMDRASSILRDNYNEHFKSVVCDDEDLAESIKEYLQIIDPGKEKIVKYYDKPTPLFEYYNIEQQIKKAFGKNVNIKGSKGGYLVIEHTEALHVIDVNSGNHTHNKESQEKSAVNLNKLAAEEIARQLKLRDMGGIIVVDFVDMNESKHRKELYDHLKSCMSSDRAKHKILPPSRFGLVQITRQRVKPANKIPTQEDNPNSNGKVEAPIVLLEKLESSISKLSEKSPGSFYIHTHPFVAAYLEKGIFSLKHKWSLKYKRRISIIPRDSFKYLEFRVFDKNQKEIFALSN